MCPECGINLGAEHVVDKVAVPALQGETGGLNQLGADDQRAFGNQKFFVFFLWSSGVFDALIFACVCFEGHPLFL